MGRFSQRAWALIHCFGCMSNTIDDMFFCAANKRIGATSIVLFGSFPGPCSTLDLTVPLPGEGVHPAVLPLQPRNHKASTTQTRNTEARFLVEATTLQQLEGHDAHVDQCQYGAKLPDNSGDEECIRKPTKLSLTMNHKQFNCIESARTGTATFPLKEACP